MSIRIRHHLDKTYKVLNNTWYHIDTNDMVITLLDEFRQKRRTIRLNYGNVVSGRCWDDRDETGTISRSTGPVKVPLLIEKSDDDGGDAILTHCIVRIASYKLNHTLYQSSNFHMTPEGYHAWLDEVKPHIEQLNIFDREVDRTLEAMFNCGYDPEVAANELMRKVQST